MYSSDAEKSNDQLTVQDFDIVNDVIQSTEEAKNPDSENNDERSSFADPVRNDDSESNADAL
jgi:hypothetical protein